MNHHHGHDESNNRHRRINGNDPTNMGSRTRFVYGALPTVGVSHGVNLPVTLR